MPTLSSELRTGSKAAESAANVLSAIAHHLDGKEWNADTCNQVAAILRANGYVIREPNERT